MLPYWYFPQFHIGPLPINTWGFFVSLGFAVAIFVAYRRARRAGLDGNRILDLAFWIIVAAIIGARLGHVFFYNWPYYSQHLREIVRVDQGGLSSYGGFIGAILVFWWYIKKLRHPERLPAQAGSEGSRATHDSRDSSPTAQNDGLLWNYADVLMFAAPLGWAIGRIGCFLIHDHPGTLTHFVGGVKYPDGTRFDLGLVEAVNGAMLFAVFLIFSRRFEKRPGMFVAVGALWYGVVRFFTDFLRATDIPFADARYIGLTPAQYGSILLTGAGIYLVLKLRIYKSGYQSTNSWYLQRH